MKKKILLCILCYVLGHHIDGQATLITSANQITEDWLTTEGPTFHYTEHVRHIRKVFEHIKVNRFLEFGVGYSTKFFIVHSKEVISVEFVTNGTGPEWLIYCMKLFKKYRNWTPIAYVSEYEGDLSWARYTYMGASSVFKAAAYQPVYCKSYAARDPSFLDDLRNFIRLQVNTSPIDVAFIDCGICLRGDLVQQLFYRVPIIIAHDYGPKETILDNDIYGYGRIVVPSNYQEIVIADGMGTAFWIKKDKQYQELIEDLQKYAASQEP